MSTVTRNRRCCLVTPWGFSDTEREIANGITLVSTPSHGGYYLSQARQAELLARFPSFTTWAGGPWYEEDCDWAVVAIVFPTAFPASAQANAEACARYAAMYSREALSDPRLQPKNPARAEGWEQVVSYLDAMAATAS